MADYSITGDTRLDASGFNKGLSTMSVVAGDLISDLVRSATSKLAGLAQASVGVGMSFESSMSQVAATMGVSVNEIDNLTQAAKDMGRTTQFTATQAADALNYLALAGYDADKAAEVLPSVLNLAAAGGMDLAYASDLVTDAMASLNIEANKQNVDDFGNKLAMAASKANANVSQLGEAILTVGGTAANLKGGTTELTTALGVLANVGIKGAEGGTHLRNVILSLQSPTDEATKTMQKLGLRVYDAQGNMRGLDEILGDLNASMAGMTQGQKDSIINQLFNKTDLAAVNGLLAAQGEQWDSLAANIDSAGGAMEQMADTQLDNLQGATTKMQSALEGLQLEFYEYLEPSLTKATVWATDSLSTLTEALADGGPEAMLTAAEGILSDLATSIAQQLPGIMSSGVEIIAQLAEDIAAATPQLLRSGAEVIGTLVQALGTALPQLVTTGIELMEQLGSGMAEGIPQLLTQALPVVSDFASGLRENVGLLVDAGITLILNLMQGLMDGLPTLIEYLPGIISDIAGVINDNLPKILEAGIELILMLGKGLLQAVPTLVANIPQICKAIFDVFTAFRWLDIGSQIVNGLWQGLTSGWTGLISKIQGLAQQLPDVVKRILGIHSPSKVFDEIGANICKGLAQGLTTNAKLTKAAAKTVVASVTATATQLQNGVTTTTETVNEVLKNGTTQQKKVVTETSRQMVKGVLSDVKTITTTAADGSKTVTQSIEAVRDVLETTKDTHTTFADGVETTVEKVTETLADGSQQIKTVTTQTGTELVEGVNRTVKTITTEAADGSKTVEKIIEDAKDVVSTTKDTQTSLIHGVETTVETTTELLKDGSEQVSTVTTQTGKEVIEGVERTVKTVTTKTAEGVETTVKTIEDAGPQYASAGELLTTQLRTKLDSGWDDIQQAIQTDAIGAIGTLADALKNGDLEQLGLWAASYFWNACTDAQREQITSLAQGALNQLGAKLADTGAQLGQLATSLVAQFVPAAATATTGQTALNVAMDANPILLVISLIGMLVGALISFSGTNTDVANKFKSVWAGVQDFLSVIFEGLLRVVGLGIEGFVILINQLIDVYNSVAGLWDGKISRISNPAWDYADKIAADRKARQADRDKQDDALKANTAAILTANSKLAEMVKQADSLVLSDNMALSRSVAASGTARIAAAASSYTRQGDTVITQNIYSKAQTAADLQREARWEADRAKAQKR